MNSTERRVRLFFALWPPPEVARGLHAWAQAAQMQSGGRVTREETIHLTLAFLGEVEGARVDALLECARQLRAPVVDMRLDLARRWAHNGIVWAGPRQMPAALADLAAQLDALLKTGGFRAENRAFKAHISLVRRSEHEAALPALAPLAWRAEEFVLVRSVLLAAGPAYETVERFALDEGA